jgi:pyridoxal/pyridoxine/pyridoxamine kinase
MHDAQLAAIVDMMETNGLLHFTHILTGVDVHDTNSDVSPLFARVSRCDTVAGYIGSLSFLRHIVAVVRKVREAHPDAVYG